MKRKYGVLGFVAFLYQLLGVLALIGGLIVTFGVVYYTYVAVGPVFFNDTVIELRQFEALIPVGVSIVIGGLVMFGFGQLINLLRDVELNSRRTAYYSAQSLKLDQARVKAQAARARRRSVQPNAPTQPSQPVS